MTEKNDTEQESKQLYAHMGNRLRNERLKRHYTQEQMAEALGISTAYYGKIERGIHGLSLSRLLIVNQKFSIDLTYLFTGQERLNYSLEYCLSLCKEKKRKDLERILRYALELAIDG